MTRISPHFLSGEFDCRDGTPAPAHYRDQLPALCVLLEELRKHFGVVHVVSGFRTLRHNANVGGARQSYHLNVPGRLGVAADVICRTGSPSAWYALLDRLEAPGLGRYPTFVHVDTRRSRSRW